METTVAKQQQKIQQILVKYVFFNYVHESGPKINININRFPSQQINHLSMSC